VAIRAFEKAGFTRLRQYDDPIYGRCWVMTAQLPVEDADTRAG
jgi:hypothetical protein